MLPLNLTVTLYAGLTVLRSITSAITPTISIYIADRVMLIMLNIFIPTNDAYNNDVYQKNKLHTN